MKRCVIFDMDGVIIDSEPIHFACEKEIFGLLGIDVSDEEHNSFVGSTDDIMWTRIANKHGLSLENIPGIKQIKKTLYLEYLKQKINIEPIPHIPELIKRLHKNNFLLVLASSSPHEQINYILETIGIKQFFHSIISGDDVSEGKPNPEIFLQAAKSVGVDPGSCVVIEDSYNGIIAAKAANMKCIAYKNRNSGNQDLSKSDVIVSSIRNITIKKLK